MRPSSTPPTVLEEWTAKCGRLRHAFTQRAVGDPSTRHPAAPIELTERLSAFTGGVLVHGFFASESVLTVEIGLKISFHYWHDVGRDTKREFVCLRQGYHGKTLGGSCHSAGTRQPTTSGAGFFTPRRQATSSRATLASLRFSGSVASPR